MFSAINAFYLPFQGLSLIFSSGIRRFVLIPLLINIVLYSIIAWIAFYYFDAFIAWLLPADSWLSYLEWILWPLFALSYTFIMFYTFTILANIIAAPFNGLLAEKVEEKLTGQAPPEISGSILKDTLPAIMAEFGKLSYFLTRAIPILILMVIPGVNIVASLLWLLFGFWFLTIEYGDYTMANHGLKPKEQRQLIRKKPMRTLAFGAASSLLMFIPVINLAAMPATVAGGTVYWLNHLNDKKEDNA